MRLPLKRWGDGTPFTLHELRLLLSLRRAGCRDRLPLFGSWWDENTNLWRVRCRLNCVRGRARR